MFQRAAAVIAILLTALAARGYPAASIPQSTVVIAGLGHGQVRLNGFWQFHTGDDPRWASPSFDDSRWEPITASTSWGNQDHPDYTGFAW
jgi:hypothetical protein